MTQEKAPITQLGMTVQFNPPLLPLNPIDLADAYAPFRPAFPIFEQVARAGPMPLEAGVFELMSPFGHPRNVFFSPDRALAIFFQEDRFTYLWNRTNGFDEASGYPGFSECLKSAIEHWDNLARMLFKPDERPEALVGEILYQDNFYIDANADEGNLADIYTVLSDNVKIKPANYNFQWTEPLPEAGFLLTQIQGPVIANERTASLLQTTARFRVSDSWDGLEKSFNAGHDAIADSFTRLIHPAFRPI